MTETDPVRHFSGTYQEARTKFLAAADGADFRRRAAEHPNERGRQGETLAMDFAVAGPAAARAGLILLSATHGVEGFCGSGVQTGLLRGGILNGLARNIRVILVHGHNPYGFSWLRRVNEDNVDLNRNYVDHDKPYPVNAEYRSLKDAIAPASLDAETLAGAEALLRAYAEEHGAFALQEAMTRGQYEFADGLYYGGSFPTWSNRTLTAGLRRACEGLKQVALLDFHTGLGPSGHGEMISECEPGSPAERRLNAWFGSDLTSTRTGTSVSPDHFGTIDGGLASILPDMDVTPCAIEFGTVRTADVFNAVRADNWLHLHGNLNSPGADAIKTAIKNAFYPETDDWKGKVWERSLWAVERMAQGLCEAAVR